MNSANGIKLSTYNLVVSHASRVRPEMSLYVCDDPFRKKTNRRMNKMSSVNGYWVEKEYDESAAVPGKLIKYLDALGECDNPVCPLMDAERALRNENYRVRLVLRGLRSSLTITVTTYFCLFCVDISYTGTVHLFCFRHWS